MKVLKFLLFLAAGLLVLVFGAAFFARTNYHIERSVEIDAPIDTVYKQVRFFKNFERWSPWHGLDPDQKTIISANDGEVGATYIWEGNGDVGAGIQTLKYVSPDSVHIELQRTQPWESTSPTYFKLTSVDSAKTRVTWVFDMHIGRPWNAGAMLTDVNARVGKDWERGLGKLKALCEKIMRPKYLGYEVTQIDVPARDYIGLRGMVDTTDILQFFADSLPKALEMAKATPGDSLGVPSGLFWLWAEGKADVAAAFSLKIAKNKKPANGGSLFHVPGGKAVCIDYYGSYAGSGEAHAAMDVYMKEKKLQSMLPVIEEYVTDPATEKDTAKWLTRVIYFVEPKQDTLSVPR